MSEKLNRVEFSVPLSGSNLFDFHAYATAKNLCAMFPPLDFEYERDRIHIHGELNDEWYGRWCRAVFAIGSVTGE